MAEHKHVDVVIVGSGWSGGIMAAELTRAGMSVVMLEKGAPHAGSQYGAKMDELRFNVDLELMSDTSRDTLTMRHDVRESATPLRRFGSFLLGTGTGGSSLHWSGVSYRYLPYDFMPRSHIVERYGRDAIPEEMTIQDWGITYQDLEPFYDRAEYMAGIAGKAGNICGVRQSGGNPFEGARSREYPVPPMKTAPAPLVFRKAAVEAGYTPYPEPSGNLSTAYTNPDGVARAACNFCGYCSRYACEVAAKADPTVTVLPVAERSGRFELRHGATVLRVEHSGDRATGVTYIDVEGARHRQTADIVVLAAHTFANTRLLLLSGIGEPYDPARDVGTVGRNFAFQPMGYSTAWFEDRNFKRFMGAGANGWVIDDFAGDNFDHAGLGFIGGGILNCEQTGSPPIGGIALPPHVPAFGAAWKEALRHYYPRSMSLVFQGENPPYRGHFLDLDPTYADAFGDPLLRFTYNFTDNERKMVAHAATGARRIAAAAGASHVQIGETLDTYYDVGKYQTSHITGGAVMGTDRTRSTVNTFCQMWTAPNLFIVGCSAFPQNGGRNPSLTMMAVAYRSADAIVRRYRKSPGPLE